ncbi:MAG: MBL fold metallo-hydrolase [Anaerolineae bacterium]|nr:MBL fold metallo-hydrolase [Anaerolineae bacterium]
MFEIVFLGTSASAPSIYRGLPALAVMAGEYRFLVDCGEGTQRQILKSGIGFKRLNRILLTHGHLDHILGLGGLLSTFMRWESIDQLEIWGGTQALHRVQDLIYGVVLRGQKPPMPIHLIDLKPGLIFESKKFTIEAFSVTHRGTGNYGFVFEERPRRPFLVERAEALGVPAGPQRGQLTAGQPVTLADGRIIQPDDVLGETLPGARLVVIGDIARTDNLPAAVQGADALVMESTYCGEDVDFAEDFGHMTAARAATYALESGAKTLILTHLSRRNRERDVLEEARAIFPETFVARDFDHFAISKNKPVARVEPGS